jgi:heterodisulfide reductase subunit B
MPYLYYPGCSLQGTAKEYDLATRALMQALGVELIELEDWTCCGASAADGVNALLSLALPARNLALAQRQHPGLPILVPCSACYLNLKKIEFKIRAQPEVLQTINAVLSAEDLALQGPVEVRHLLQVLAEDIGPGRINRQVSRPLPDLTVAPYYGCQCLRPYAVFDDPEAPRSMEGLIRATGASVWPWTMGAKCCGAAHMNTEPEVALELTGAILQQAQGADAVATVCPMCQMNLEGYQGRASRLKSARLSMSVVYLPQLLGLAMGISPAALGTDLNLALTRDFQEKLRLMPAGAREAGSGQSASEAR